MSGEQHGVVIDSSMRPPGRFSAALLGAAMLLGTAVFGGCATAPRLGNDTLAPLQPGAITTANTSPGTTLPSVGPTPTTGPTPPTGLPNTLVAPVATRPPTPVKWGGWSHDAVPPLVFPGERGTGCGSPGTIGDAIPDGIWNVVVGDGTGADRFFTASSIIVDVRCVYTGLDGQQRWTAACGASPLVDACIGQSPGWFVVNNSKRLRTLPVAVGLKYGVGALGKSPCPGVSVDPNAPGAPWRNTDSWIVIDQGTVSAVITACPPG